MGLLRVEEGKGGLLKGPCSFWRSGVDRREHVLEKQKDSPSDSSPVEKGQEARTRGSYGARQEQTT